MDGAALHISDQAPPLDAVAREVERIPIHDSDEARLRRAFDRCADDLYRFIAFRVGGDRHAADDLLQQACYEAARHGRTPGGDDAAQAWLFGIAKNLIRKHFRHVRREARRSRNLATSPNPVLSESIGTDQETSSKADAAPHLLTAMASLNESDQQLLLGSYFEGRSQEELARMIGVSVRAIEGRLYRARQALRQALSAKLEEGKP